MILYVNGDSHTASAEATNSYAFAEDDPALYYLGRQPQAINGTRYTQTRNLGDGRTEVL